MNIFLENVNLNSTSGPNSFANKLVKYLYRRKHTVTNRIDDSDVHLCFIESYKSKPEVPLFQRLDGIYFNSDQDFINQNSNIEKTYRKSCGTIFQTEFNKQLTFKYFGARDNTTVIHNGADIELISDIKPLIHPKLDNCAAVWACASKWRPHKRLSDNISYFLQHSGENDRLVVAGHADKRLKDDKIIYVGEIGQKELLSLYKASKYFIHLAWLDHCPNVVVDARASRCKIICSSTGGTKEVAGPDATIIEEEKWDFKPVRLYEPPKMDFSKKVNNSFDSDYNMENVAKRYEEFMEYYKK